MNACERSNAHCERNNHEYIIARTAERVRKPVEAFVTETHPDEEGGELSRSIGLFQLTMFGVGATIGTGIFIILTDAVPEAGPAIILSASSSPELRPPSRRYATRS